LTSYPPRPHCGHPSEEGTAIAGSAVAERLARSAIASPPPQANGGADEARQREEGWVRAAATLLAFAATLFTTAAPAQDRTAGTYPNRPIRLLIPFPPGGGNDTMARAIGSRLTESLRQQIIYDNRPGANGLVAAELAARAAADGYTLFMANAGSHGINPGLYRKLPYDAIKDFTPVSLLGTTANILVVPASSPANTIADLIALAKAKAGQITYGSNGIGSSQHLAGVMFGTAFGVELVHVPYKGTGPVLTDLLGGQIGFSFSNALAVTQHIKANRLRALAITSLRRSKVLPNVPAVAESVPGFEALSWWGVAGPARMPAEIVATLNTDIVRHLASDGMREQLERQGVEARGTTPREFGDFIRAELAKWGKVVKDSGAKVD